MAVGTAGDRDINELLAVVLERGASDLHVAAGLPPTLRLNGALMPLDGDAMSGAETRDVVYAVLTEEQRNTLERKWEVDFAYSMPDKSRFRVNAYMQRGCVGAAFRVIPSEIGSFAELGLPSAAELLAGKPRGLVLVTGPTGSGKSTTLASMIDHINDHRTLHVMTVEDPIEYVHAHKRSMVNQREVGSDTKTFASALRHVLRQDPDVIMVGEMRDLETIGAALTAAETGHLVLATLHTQDAAQTVDRVIDVFPPHQQQQVRFQLSAALQGIISQQLLPTIDSRRRVLAAEVLLCTAAIRNLIREAKSHQLQTAMQTGHQHGMQTMDESLADLYKRGRIAYETALAQAHDPNVVGALLGRAGR